MKRIKGHLIFILVLFVLSLVFFNKILHKGVILDNIHYINDLTFLSYNTLESLKNYELPLWTPYFYSGQPLLAVPESYMFDLNFLLILFFRNIYFAMNLAIILYFFIAGLGMYWLIYELVSDKKAAFISAIIYMLNGFMHSFIITGHINILEGYALIPFIFLFVHKALKAKNWIFYSVLAGIFFALQIFAGSMILFLYTVLIIGIYFAINLARKNFLEALIKVLSVGLIISIVALSLSAMKLMPVIEFTKISSRGADIPFQEFLGEPVSLKYALQIFVSSISYNRLSAAIGIAGFILLIYGIFNYKKRVVAFSVILVVLSLLYSSGFVANIFYKVPGFNKLRHVERALVLFAFSASILCAYGFVLLKSKYKSFLKFEKAVFVIIAVLIIGELVFLHKFPMPAKIIKPSDIPLLEYISKDDAKSRTMNLALNDIIGAAGYNYFSQKGISEVKGGGGIWINDYVTYLFIAQQTMNSKMMGMLNVKYVIAKDLINSTAFTLVNKFNVCKDCALPEAFGPYLYENKAFLPRYYVVPNAVLVVGENSKVRDFMYNLIIQKLDQTNTVLITGSNINQFSSDILKKFNFIILLKDSVNQESLPKLQEYVANGGIIIPDIIKGQNSASDEDVSRLFNHLSGSYKEINIKQYSNHKITLDLNGEKGWLVASERFAYFPGWKASINDKDVNIYKADNAIAALHLDGEKGQLVFKYKPKSYRNGKIISLIAFILIIIYFGYFVYKNKSKSGDKNQT